VPNIKYGTACGQAIRKSFKNRHGSARGT
jgi:hypothetical protein